MSDVILWETQFRDFLLSAPGRELIDKAFDRHQASTECRTVLSVFFDGLTVADSCPLLLLYLKTKPASTISRCHQILSEVCRQILTQKAIKPQKNLVITFFHSLISNITRLNLFSSNIERIYMALMLYFRHYSVSVTIKLKFLHW